MPRAWVSLVSLLIATPIVVAQNASPWSDPSPHRRRLVPPDAASGVEVLDWGGRGRPLILLAQLGSTAHIYDGWAPTLTNRFHVYGVTRRGYGASGSLGPEHSIERLGRDVLAVMDDARLRRPIVVGNGFAGEELTWLGSRYPDRVGGLVYLDAAYDRTNAGTELPIARRIPPRVPQPSDLASAGAFARWMSAGLGGAVPEAEVRQMATFDADGRVNGERTPVTTQQRLRSFVAPPAYAQVNVPVLAIYARPAGPETLPGCRDAAAAEVRSACQEFFDWTQRHLAEGQAQLKAVRGRVEMVELAGANAFVFLAHQEAVRNAIATFAGAVQQ